MVRANNREWHALAQSQKEERPIVHDYVREPRACSKQLPESMVRANNREWHFLAQSQKEGRPTPLDPPISMLRGEEG